ncbi:Fe-S cluster assembly protein SufD [Acidipropionibacterium jensenii]|uniref:Fe-S cluster assembly protein SufD n=1 Tax=Acidipropionibacterium jensenii TaxID=1749 RepID=UPI000BC32993
MTAPVQTPQKGHNVTIEGDVESHLHPRPSWQLADHPMPTGREEIWRFTPVREFAPILAEGQTRASLEWAIKAPEQVTVTDLAPDDLRGLAETPQDRLSAVAATNAVNPSRRIEIPADAQYDDPIDINLTGTGSGESVYQNLVVEIGRFAHVTLVVRYKGSANLGENWTFRIGDGAEATIVFVHEWDDDAVHAAQIAFELGRDTTVRTAQATFGGKAVRISQTASYQGPGADLSQLGVYFADASQHIEHRLFVDHNAPRTKSRVDFRGCLQGAGAHTVWVGDVLIRPVATGIDTYESNKNLVLTEGCRADAVPNLEIQTGNIVGAGHSASTGRFDAEQLFYLESRGIEEEEARRLVVHGFFTDIVRRIGVEEISNELMDRIEEELLESLGASTQTAADQSSEG